MERFLRDEKQALQPLPMRAFAARERELVRRVANDSFVEVDTVRYSVPHALVRDRVKVRVGVDQVRIFHGTTLVATHRRSFEPYSVVSDPAHFAGLLRPPGAPVEDTVSRLADFGRSLAEYAAVVETRGVA